MLGSAYGGSKGNYHPTFSSTINDLLQGHRIARIVVESADDIPAFRKIGSLPIVHLAELANV